MSEEENEVIEEVVEETPEVPIVSADDEKPPQPAEFGDDWRDKIGGENASRLERYASPNAAIDALISAQTKLSERGPTPMPGDDATEEDLAAWRVEAGLPEAPDKYEVTLGRDVDAVAQVAVDGLVETAFAEGLNEKQTNSVLSRFFDEQDKAMDARDQQDITQKETAEEMLRTEWGAEYKRNIGLITSYLGEHSQKILTGRMADGNPTGSDPDVLRMILGKALENNPRGVTVPASGGNMVESAVDERDAILKQMSENRSAYNKDTKMQGRLLELNDFIARQEEK